jgi:hypothetical protein
MIVERARKLLPIHVLHNLIWLGATSALYENFVDTSSVSNGLVLCFGSDGIDILHNCIAIRSIQLRIFHLHIGRQNIIIHNNPNSASN